MKNNIFINCLNLNNISDSCRLFLDIIDKNKWIEEQNIKLRNSLLYVDRMILNELPKYLLNEWCKGLSEYSIASDFLNKIPSKISSNFDFVIYRLQKKDIRIDFDFNKNYIADFLKSTYVCNRLLFGK